MADQSEDRVLALAGVFQAATLVRQIAREGRTPSAPFEASIHSLFQIDADSTEAVFGRRASLRTGLQSLVGQLGAGGQSPDPEVTRYAASLMLLERRLMRDRARLEALHAGISGAARQADEFSRTHDNVIARLADLYLETISTIGPRILVHGEPHFLEQPTNANRIRSLLLAGIRAAVLWRQVGGGRLGLLLGRRRMVERARRILGAESSSGDDR